MPHCVFLTTEMIRVILGLINCHSHDTDYFFDEEKQLVFRWDGDKKEYVDLQAHLSKYLNHEKVNH